MIRATLLTTLILGISGCSHFNKQIDEVGETLLYVNIEKDDYDSFAREVKRFNSSKSKGKMSEGFGHYLLGYATSRKNWRGASKNSSLIETDYLCRPQYVELLLKEGANVSNDTSKFSEAPLVVGHISGAVNNLCENSLRSLLEGASSNEIAQASKAFSLIYFERIKNDPKLAPLIVSVTTLLVNKNNELCNNSKPNCEALEHIKNEFKGFEKRERSEMERKKFYGTKEGQKALAIGEACEEKLMYHQYLNRISEENEKGKISGYVNASLLKDWGDKAYRHKEKLNSLVKEYKLNIKTLNCSK